MGEEANTLDFCSTPITNFQRFGDDAAWFRRILLEHEVNLVGGSPLDRALVAMASIADASRFIPPSGDPAVIRDVTRKLIATFKIDVLLREGVAVAHLVRAIRKTVGRNPRVLDGKWHLFRGSDVVLARYNGRTSGRELVWELYIAAIGLKITADLQVAGNDNPDVRLRVRDTAWGIECKVFNSSKRKRQIKSVETAAKQLQTADIDRGVIAVNITGAIDHEPFLRSIREFGTDLFSGAEDISWELRERARTVSDQFYEPAFLRWIHAYPKVRAIFFQAQTIAIVNKTLSLNSYGDWLAVHPEEVADLRMSGRFKLSALEI